MLVLWLADYRKNEKNYTLPDQEYMLFHLLDAHLLETSGRRLNPGDWCSKRFVFILYMNIYSHCMFCVSRCIKKSYLNRATNQRVTNEPSVCIWHLQDPTLNNHLSYCCGKSRTMNLLRTYTTRCSQSTVSVNEDLGSRHHTWHGYG